MRPTKVLAIGTKIPDGRLKRFLLDVVNARVAGAGDGAAEAGDETDGIFHHYSEFLPHVPGDVGVALKALPTALVKHWQSADPLRFAAGQEDYRRKVVAEMRGRLQAVWKAGDAEAAKWRLAAFQNFMHGVTADGLRPWPPAEDGPPPEPGSAACNALPPDAPLSQALAYLGQNLRKLKKCTNRGCDTPFLVAKRPEDQCCSEDCANEMRSRSRKRDWARKRKGLAGRGRGGPKAVAKRVAAKGTGNQGGQQAIDDSALKEFVLDIVNADEGKIDDGRMYFFSQYPGFFPTKDKDIKAVVSIAGHSPLMLEKMKDEWPAIYHRGLMRGLHEGLRGLWQAEERSTAERLLFGLQSFVHSQVNISRASHRTVHPPASHPIQQALLWVQSHLAKLRRCGNVGCPRPQPFFVAETKERYCSKACAKAAGRPHKLAWWFSDKGKEWRRKRAEGKGRPRAPAPDTGRH